MSTELARELWDAKDRDMIVRHLRRLGEQRDGIYPFGSDGPQAWSEQGIFTLQWEHVLVDLDFVTTDRHGETHAEIAIYWSDPTDPLAMLRTRLNLLSMSAVDRLANALAKRTPDLRLDWRRMLDHAVRWTMEEYRRGDPGLLLRDAPDLPIGSELLTDPALLEADGLSILFGDGGTGKSWIGLALAASLQAGESLISGIEVTAAHRVGYIDWEWSARRHKRRLLQLTGPDMPDIAYIRCSRSLHEERDRLRRWVRYFGIDYAIVDSVGLACGAEPESAEIANPLHECAGRARAGGARDRPRYQGGCRPTAGQALRLGLLAQRRAPDVVRAPRHRRLGPHRRALQPQGERWPTGRAAGPGLRVER